MPDLLRTYKIGRVEVFDLGGHFAGVGVGIELGDPIHAGSARDKALPVGLLTNAVGGDDPDARDDHAPSISHETVCPLNH